MYQRKWLWLTWLCAFFCVGLLYLAITDPSPVAGVCALVEAAVGQWAFRHYRSME